MRVIAFLIVCLALVGTATMANSDVTESTSITLVDHTTTAVEAVLGADIKSIIKSIDYSSSLVDLTPIESNSTSVECKKKCGKCVKKVAGHIVHEIVKGIKKACKEAKEPRFKKHCKWIKEHKAETLGYIVGRFSPFRDAYNFCFGAGQCKHPGSQIKEIAPEAESTAVATEEEEMDPISMLKELDAEFQDKSETEIQELVQSELSEMNEEEGNEVSKDGKKCCKKCFRKALKCTVRAIIKSVIKKCKETKCPFIKKWCAWAKKHKKFVKGYLIARTKPWKFAAGFCFGRGDCKFGSVEHRAHEEEKLAIMFGLGN